MSLSLFFKSTTHAFHGIQHVWQDELNFKIEVICAIAVLLFGMFVQISRIEWLFVIILIFLVLAGEMMNSGFEKIVDVLLPRYGEKARILKDIMAGFVLTLAVSAAAAAVVLFYPYVRIFFTSNH